MRAWSALRRDVISYFMIPNVVVMLKAILLHLEALIALVKTPYMLTTPLKITEDGRVGTKLNVAKHVIFDAPLHGDWFPVFVLDSGRAAVAGAFLHSQHKFSVELGLRLHLLSGGLDVVYVCAGVWLALGLDRGLLPSEQLCWEGVCWYLLAPALCRVWRRRR